MQPNFDPKGERVTVSDLLEDRSPFWLAYRKNKANPLIFVPLASDPVDQVTSALCALRSHGLMALVQLAPQTGEPPLGQRFADLFSLLRYWDTLSLANVLVLLDPLSEGSQLVRHAPALAQEAKSELQWLRQWIMALNDKRFCLYPQLPYRSYVRKVVRENALFVAALLQNLDSREFWDAIITDFLKEKKKVVCRFPKNQKQLQQARTQKEKAP